MTTMTAGYKVRFAESHKAGRSAYAVDLTGVATGLEFAGRIWTEDNGKTWTATAPDGSVWGTYADYHEACQRCADEAASADRG